MRRWRQPETHPLPLCPPCWSAQRLLTTLQANETEAHMYVEPVEPGLAIYAFTDDEMYIVVEPDGTVRERTDEQ